jgi:integrase
MALCLNRVDQRARLAIRRDPYWQRLTAGQFIGFRRISAGTPGTWLARFYDGKRYHSQRLGDFANLLEKDRYDAALAAALPWFRHKSAGGLSGSLSVSSACAAYTDYLSIENSAAAANDARGRFRRLIDRSPLGSVKLAKLTSRHISDWKQTVLAVCKAKSSFNRNAAALRAALNLAYKRQEIISDIAWRDELRPLRNATQRRKLYLSPTDRRLLIAGASDEVRPFLISLTLIPVRPGDIANLRVSDFDEKTATLRIPAGKTRARGIPLPSNAVNHFRNCSRNKHPAAWLIGRHDGSQWKRYAWRDQVRQAVRAAGLPVATVAYTLRHSTITDLVTGGLDLFTVAQVSGTSIAMIEAHYGHLQHEHARAALERLAVA